MLVLVFVLALGILSVVNLRLARSMTYPPFVFCATWMGALALLWALGDTFYPVSIGALGYFIFGAAAFSAGGFAALLPNLGTFEKRSRPVSAADRRIVQVALDIGLVLAVGALPIYFRYMKQMAAFSKGKGSDWQQMRRGIIAVMNLPGGAGFRIEPLLLPSFLILALLAFYEYDGGRVRRWRTYLFLLIAAGFALSSSGRSEVLLLMVGLVAIAWTKWDPPQLKLISTAAFAFVLLFGANQILLEKTNASSRASLSENLPAVANGFASYAMGGIVGFDYVLRHPGVIENGWKPTRLVTSVLNKLGGNYREPSHDLAYVGIGSGNVTNVYTAYFAFVDYGMMVAGCFLVFLGAVSTLAYRYALRGSPLGVLLFGTSLYGCVMSIFAEEWFARFAFYLKAAVIVFVLYEVLPRFWRMFSRACARGGMRRALIVEAGLAGGEEREMAGF